jgi:hypothetical protein
VRNDYCGFFSAVSRIVADRTAGVSTCHVSARERPFYVTSGRMTLAALGLAIWLAGGVGRYGSVPRAA